MIVTVKNDVTKTTQRRCVHREWLLTIYFVNTVLLNRQLSLGGEKAQFNQNFIIKSKICSSRAVAV